MYDLGLLDDLYCASCAKLEALLQQANILLSNGFKRPDQPFFTFLCAPLTDIGPITLGAFGALLLTQREILLSETMMNLLDSAIEVRNSLVPGQTPTQGNGRGDRIWARTAMIENEDRDDDDIQRPWIRQLKNLSGITQMSSGMIFGQLSEKHRQLVPTRDSGLHHILQDTEAQPTPYISPYNLDERWKKLIDPNRAELPCICDPDCICYDLCASDPTQNCLCEGNALFVSVTEGMDIDELDVPDLVRRERSRSNSASESEKSLSNDDIDNVSLFNGPPSLRGEPSLEELQTQQSIQAAQVKSDFQLVNSYNPSIQTPSQRSHVPSRWDTASLVTVTDDDSITSIPLREALTLPFSKQCDTPPQRPSTREAISRRLFGSRKSKHAVMESEDPLAFLNQGPVRIIKHRSQDRLILPDLSHLGRLSEFPDW